jgi:hypothetical protein
MREAMKKEQPKKQIKKMSQGGRGGRPKADENELRAGRIGVSVNKEEEAVIAKKAAAHHMSKAFFLREAGLDHRMRRPIPAINFEAHRDLGRMAANLNQLVMIINSGKNVGLNAESVQRLYELLQSTRRALLKGDDDDREN